MAKRLQGLETPLEKKGGGAKIRTESKTLRFNQIPTNTRLLWLATREGASVSGTIESVRRDGAPVGAKTVLKRTLGVLSRRKGTHAPLGQGEMGKKSKRVPPGPLGSVRYILGRMPYLGR